MIKYLSSKISSNQWIGNASTGRPHGVLLRRSRGQYITEPPVVHPVLLQAITKLNVEVAFTMSTETTEVILSILKPEENGIMLADGSQLQIVDSLAEIARYGSGAVKKFQYAALVREEGFLLVWHDDLDKILGHTKRFVLKHAAVSVREEAARVAAPKFLDEKFVREIDYVASQVLNPEGERKRAASDGGCTDGLPDLRAVVGGRI